MTTNLVTNEKKNKHLILNQKRLDRAKKILGTRTETETVELALERVITEAEVNKQAWAAHKKFVREMISGKHRIVDVYGNLE